MSDARFVAAAHKMLREQLGYRCVLTVPQLLSSEGFAERKMLLILDVLSLCRTKHAELTGRDKRRTGGSTPRRLPTAVSPRCTPRTITSEQRVTPPEPVMASPTVMPNLTLTDLTDLPLPRSAPPPRPMIV